MKIFIYMGRNPRTKSRVSWKLWKINRDGRRVTTFWGPVTLIKRRVVPLRLQSSTRTFKSVDAAEQFQARRIRSKMASGYQRRTRARS